MKKLAGMLFVGGLYDGQTVPAILRDRDTIDMPIIRELDLNTIITSPDLVESIGICSYVVSSVWLREDPGMVHAICCPCGWSLSEIIEAYIIALRRGLRPGRVTACRKFDRRMQRRVLQVVGEGDES